MGVHGHAVAAFTFSPQLQLMYSSLLQGIPGHTTSCTACLCVCCLTVLPSTCLLQEMIARGLWSELSAPHFNSEEAIQALFLAAVSLRGRLQIDMNDSLPWLHCCLALCRATHHTVDTPTLIHLLQVASKVGGLLLVSVSRRGKAQDVRVERLQTGTVTSLWRWQSR